MRACTNATQQTGTPSDDTAAGGARPPVTSNLAGVLRPDEGLRHFTLGRPAAHPDLDLWVDRYWTVRWELPPGASYLSSVLSHPALHLSVESGDGPRHGFPMPAALLHGVVTRRFDIVLRGEGRVFGVKFRPGGFAAFTGLDTGAGVDVASYTDRAVLLADALGGAIASSDDADADGGVAELQASILAADEDDKRVALMDEFLLARRPSVADPRYQELLAIVAAMLADRSLTSVQAVTDRFNVEPRTLQRLFRRYVGVGPKWVLRRFRLHDAQLMLDAGEVEDLATLATTLGWFDQAHFTRDFRAAVGVPPRTYTGPAAG
ncbi:MULTISPECIES: helix-turn-helix domain-containing protein [unclassified Frankia]|uniref:helix-turn-helix domain-containing protein n=1 Tax=unclassified Frankia TaxID=2632575 RepID=UPI0027DDC725|nr:MULTISPECIES: helix-turn-helix domain-containing protein [unclassified Frankia]